MSVQILMQGSLLDERAYLFFPLPHEQKTQFTKKGTRFFYFGQIQYDEYEQRKLKQFYQYVAENKITYDSTLYTEQRVLLFLQSHSYKPKDTLQAMGAHQQFRREYLPVDYTGVAGILSSGLFYVCGRDLNFRPVLVFNACLLDLKDLDGSTRAVCFIQELVIREMMLPGQVENWVAIYDLGGKGLTELPLTSLKNTISVMSANYGGRLYKMFGVNAPGSMWFMWRAVSPFLDAVTVDKIKISKTHTQETMFKNIHQSQVEVKYGGKQPNREVFWPIRLPEPVIDESRLISMKEYEDKLKRGELKNNIIHPKMKEYSV